MAELDRPFLSIDMENIQVDIDMMDFSYVEACDDWQKLYKILSVLKSGKEGHFPDVSDTNKHI
jgi:hypothetical protein